LFVISGKVKIGLNQLDSGKVILFKDAVDPRNVVSETSIVDGAFMFSNLDKGTYVVKAFPNIVDSVKYTATVYKPAISLQSSKIDVLINLDRNPSSLFVISGTVKIGLNPLDSGKVILYKDAVDPGNVVLETSIVDGVFSFPYVDKGTYVVKAFPNILDSVKYIATVYKPAISLQSNKTDVLINLERNPLSLFVISGKVKIGLKPLDSGKVILYKDAVDPRNVVSETKVIFGAFSFVHLDEGTYVLKAFPNIKDSVNYIATVYAPTINLQVNKTGIIFDLERNPKRMCSISGIVTADKKQVSSATVILYKGSVNDTNFIAAIPVKSGAFEFTYLEKNNYYVKAIPGDQYDQNYKSTVFPMKIELNTVVGGVEIKLTPIVSSECEIIDNVRLFPNPSNADVFVDNIGFVGDVSAVYLHNALGQIVSVPYVTLNEGITFNLAGLPSGYYVVEIVGTQGRVTEKILVEE